MYIYGKVQRGQCVSTPQRLLENLNIAQAQEIKEKRLQIIPGGKKAKSYRERIGQTFTVRSYKLS